jgi:hypothetical protein
MCPSSEVLMIASLHDSMIADDHDAASSALADIVIGASALVAE